MKHLVVTIHGIRTFGHWQERLESLLRSANPPPSPDHQFRFHHYKYGYFSIVAFLLPPLRWWVTRRFRLDLLRTIDEEAPDRLDIVAHSFGTHMVAWALLRIPPARRPRVHTLILAGSVLKTSFTWRDLTPIYVSRVVNDCGTRDWVLVLNQLIVPFTGMAGRLGFIGMTSDAFRNRYFHIGHSGYFLAAGTPYGSFMSERWADLILTNGAIPPVDQRSPSGPSGLLTFLLNNAEPIKLSVYVSPFLIATLWVSGLYYEADHQRTLVEARYLGSEARLATTIRADYLQRAVLLSLRSLTLAPSAEADEAVHESLRLLPRPVRTFHHDDRVSMVRFSRKGDIFMTRSPREALNLWSVSTGQQLSRIAMDSEIVAIAVGPLLPDVIALGDLDGHLQLVSLSTGHTTFEVKMADSVNELVFDRDGVRLLAGGEDGLLTVWDTQQGVRRSQVRCHDSITSLAISPKGNQVATGTRDGYVHILNYPSCRTSRVERVDGTILDLAYRPDGGALAIASTNATVQLVDSITGRTLDRLHHPLPVTSVAFSPNDGRYLATTSNDHLVRLWSSRSGELLASFTHGDMVRAPSRFSPDGQSLLTFSLDHTARVWDIGQQRETARLIHDDAVESADFTPSGHSIGTASHDGTGRLWELSTAQPSLRFQHNDNAFAVSQNEQRNLLTAAGYYKATTWNLATGGLAYSVEFKEYGDAVRALDMSSDGSRLAVLQYSGHVLVWDLTLEQQEPFEVAASHDAPAERLALRFAGDANHLAVVGSDGRIDTYLLPGGAPVATQRCTFGATTDLRFAVSPDGRLYAIGAWFGAMGTSAVTVCDSKSGTIIFDQKEPSQILSVTFSDDGQLLAVGEGNGRVRVWDIATNRLLLDRSVAGSVWGLSFRESNGDRFLLIAGEERTVRILDLDGGEEVGRIRQTDRVLSLGWGDHGRLLLTGLVGGLAEGWAWQLEDLRRIACAHLTHDFRPDEWREYSQDSVPDLCPSLP